MLPRRTVRHYSSPPVPGELIDEAIAIAASARRATAACSAVQRSTSSSRTACDANSRSVEYPELGTGVVNDPRGRRQGPASKALECLG
jgi:hypothetical protein